jgi:hypothetical protein
MPHNTEQLIREYRASKLSQKAFCKEKNIPLSTLQYHLQKSRSKAQTPSNEFIPILPGVLPKHPSTIIILRGDFSIPRVAELVYAIE